MSRCSTAHDHGIEGELEPVRKGDVSIENWTPPTKARPWQRLQGLLAKTCLIAGKLQGCHSYASRGWRQLHLASVSKGGRGAASNVLSSGGVGRTVKTRPARGPASDASRAAESAWAEAVTSLVSSTLACAGGVEAQVLFGH